MIKFPDVSHYEPKIQFGELKASGVPCVITKATQGASNTDPTYADFIKRGRSVGLIMGAYTFLNPSDPAPQIEHFLATAKLQPGDLQPIVDAEATGLSRAQTVAAMRALEAKKYHPILYCSLAYFLNVLEAPDNWPLWLAAYRSVLPPLPKGVTLFAWQNTDSAVFAGVGSPCDGNQFYGSLADLKKYTIR